MMDFLNKPEVVSVGAQYFKITMPTRDGDGTIHVLVGGMSSYDLMRMVVDKPDVPKTVYEITHVTGLSDNWSMKVWQNQELSWAGVDSLMNPDSGIDEVLSQKRETIKIDLSMDSPDNVALACRKSMRKDVLLPLAGGEEEGAWERATQFYSEKGMQKPLKLIKGLLERT